MAKLDIDLEGLRKRYTAVEPGACRVCGHDLAPGYMGPDEAKFYCSSPEAAWLIGAQDKNAEEKAKSREHWRESQVTIYPKNYGDPDVLALIEAYETLFDGSALKKVRDLAAGCAEVTPANDEVGSVARQTWETIVNWIDELVARSAQAPEPTGSAVACTCGTKTPDLRYHHGSCEARKAAGL